MVEKRKNCISSSHCPPGQRNGNQGEEYTPVTRSSEKPNPIASRISKEVPRGSQGDPEMTGKMFNPIEGIPGRVFFYPDNFRPKATSEKKVSENVQEIVIVDSTVLISDDAKTDVIHDGVTTEVKGVYRNLPAVSLADLSMQTVGKPRNTGRNGRGRETSSSRKRTKRR